MPVGDAKAGEEANDARQSEDKTGEQQEEVVGHLDAASTCCFQIQGNMPKPKNALFDLNSPIYKKGDPAQAGEAGKAVNVDKTV